MVTLKGPGLLPKPIERAEGGTQMQLCAKLIPLPSPPTRVVVSESARSLLRAPPVRPGCIKIPSEEMKLLIRSTVEAFCTCESREPHIYCVLLGGSSF